MPALSRGQENTPSIVNWFVTINGQLTDMYSMGFRIFNIVGGLPGTQVYPLAPGTFEEIADSLGHFSVGSYYAYNVEDEEGWRPALTETIGTHRIEWRWKTSIAAPYQAGFEDFEILAQSSGSSADTYISIDDVRAAGLSQADFPDATVLASIETWQALIERATSQWFVPKATIMKIDGNESNTLFFGVPIISIEYIKLNGDTTALQSDLYRVYNSITGKDDRKNPKIRLVTGTERDIYTRPFGRLLFRKGEQNQEIKGVFGYVESDMSVPKLIKRALLKLVVEKLTRPIFPTGDESYLVPPPLVGAMIGETTDAHYRMWAPVGGGISVRPPGLIGITYDREVLDILLLYKRPIGIGSPSHRNIN